jgi:DNA (cytosine-5)-methyltransferase 1
MNVVSLCAGYGGIELGLRRVIPDLRTVLYCEIEAFAVCNLVSKMERGLLEPAPVWTDLKNFPHKETFKEVVGLERFDVLTGGFP